MQQAIQAILSRLPSALSNEVVTLAHNTSQSVDQVLINLLNQSSHSLASIERMPEDRFDEWIQSDDTISELGRIFWRASWVKPSR